MIGLGLASSHAPAIFCPPELWPTVYAAIPDYMKESQPHTAKLETAEVIQSYCQRIDRAFNALAEQIAAYKPDVIVAIGDDQGEMFDFSNNPSLAVFTGDEVWGSRLPFYVDEPAENSHVHISVDSSLARHLHKELLKHGFDPSSSSICRPIGRRPERGFCHAITMPIPRLVPALDIPIIPVLINCYFPPMPSGQRCWDIGTAIAKILGNCPERIAIYASGGMSHDPAGPRAGWIDEPLDRWILERIEQNRGHELVNLFSFDSATMRGGTGELRAWIAAAGACQWSGKTVEYFPAHHAKSGLGFCYWPTDGAENNRALR
jgi:hypothetical protein